jgi:drug/metabolite transporter (DMT)-like permease
VEYSGEATRVRGVLAGLAAAVLFGASPPLAKLLLGDVSPLMFSALLYLGAGAALSVMRAVVSPRDDGAAETPLRREDAWPLLLLTVSGGVVGPFLLLIGLQRLAGAEAALLLNLEAVFTIGLAVVVFGEHLDRAEAVAACLIVAGAVVLTIEPGARLTTGGGALAIAGACLCWALDNNLSQRLSLRDPIAVVRLKALGAGLGSLGLALLTGASFPNLSTAAVALLLGALSFGVSLVLDLHALRTLGAAREAAIFATAPFVGALLAIPVLGERLGARDMVAAAAMALGVCTLVRARHGHVHVHEELFHDHAHTHDVHHQHAHAEEPPPGIHAHPHRHEPLTHDHAHVSDLHHRHAHRPTAPILPSRRGG